jgi:dipeptidase E
VLFLTRDIHSKKDIQTKIAEADLIYVGGGNTLRMLKLWRTLGVDTLLKKAYQRGTVLAGLSAGALCWFRYGASDARRFMKGGSQDAPLMRVRGLGLVPCTASPHHVREKKRRDTGLVHIMARTPGVGLALDDGAALCLTDTTYQVYSSIQGRGVRKAIHIRGTTSYVPITSSGTMHALLSRD